MRTMCKSKIRGATITDTKLHYEGSIGIDREIIDAAEILPWEKVQVVNLNNGTRLETYVIEEKAGSGRNSVPSSRNVLKNLDHTERYTAWSIR